MINIPIKPLSVNQAWQGKPKIKCLYSNSEIQFLIKNYPNKGKEFCAKSLGRSVAAIRSKVSNMGLSLNLDTDFFRDFQKRAAKTKVGKKRPKQSSVMSEKYKNGEIPHLINTRTPEQKSKDLINWHKENKHPKGMLGKTHTEATKSKVSKRSIAMWADPKNIVNSKENRQRLSDNAMKSMGIRQKSMNGNIYSKGKKGTIKIKDKSFFARSSWEANIAAYYQFLKDNGGIKDWEHEPEKFVFDAIKFGTRSYLPDFKITENNGNIFYVEVKGYMDAKSKTKLKRFKKYFPQHKLLLIQSKEYNAIKKQRSLFEYWGALD